MTPCQRDAFRVRASRRQPPSTYLDLKAATELRTNEVDLLAVRWCSTRSYPACVESGVKTGVDGVCVVELRLCAEFGPKVVFPVAGPDNERLARFVYAPLRA